MTMHASGIHAGGGRSYLRIVRAFAVTCLLAFGLVGADARSTDAEAAAPQFNCGGVNQAPCLFFGCGSGLVASRGLCVKRDSLGFPTNCGDWNELACEVWANLRPCKAGLVEHGFVLSGPRCKKPDETFPSQCGSLNQRACTIVEHMPSCKSTLVESFFTCVARDSDGFPTNCGGNGEFGCLQLQACKSDLVLDIPAGAKCLPCGEDGRFPCLNDLCKPGYRFNFNPFSPGCLAMGPNTEPDCACSVPPETTPPGEPIHGFADLHTHPFANLAFGGLQLWGKVFDPGGIRTALPWCDYATDVSAVSLTGDPVTPVPFLGVGIHGVGGTGAIFEALGMQGFGHDVRGVGAFEGWPKWKTIQHQQMYYKWIERAFRGGLKLMIVHAVNNEFLCSTGNRKAGFGCDDMAAVDRQLKAAKDLEAFVDAQSGGPGTGWFRIATSGAHAREIITSGKMAAVLGIEVDTLFGCRDNGTCTAANVLAQLDKYYNLGVRHVFPVHFFNNGYGAPAVYERDLSPINFLMTGAAYQTEDCSATYGFDGDDPVHCNVAGLTEIGEALIRGLIRKKMIIDVDHMSAKMLTDVLGIVEAENYPVVSGHSEFLDITAGERKAERVLTSDFADRIRNLGGMFAPILAQKTTDLTTAFGDKVENNCSHSSKSWAQAYLYAVEKMKGGTLPPAVGIGSDLNGGIESIGPRFGTDACADKIVETAMQSPTTRVTYPFVAHGRAASQTFNQLRTGDRSWDINTDGVANVGLLPDFIQDLKEVGLSDEDLAPLFRSAEHYVAMWERIGARGTAPPTTAATIAPLANAAGWHNSDVAITFAATPAPGGQGISGITYGATGAHPISTTTAPGAMTSIALAQEGATEVSFHARDLGGAIETAKELAIQIDRTPPLAHATVAPGAPNDAGWYNTPVTVSFTGTDTMSGVADCDEPVVLSADGATQFASGACRDVAGNQSQPARAEGINLDQTPPQLTVPSAGSFEAAQPLTMIADSEALIGFLGAASAQDALDPAPEIGHDAPLELPLGTTTVTFVATDRAGNAVESATSVTLRGRPALAWMPAAAVYGTPVTAAQLNAAAVFGGAPVPGTFEYSIPAGVVLNAGVHVLSVTFTPDDHSRYLATKGIANFIVAPARLTIAADDKEMVLKGSLPGLTARFNGFVNNDTPASLDVAPSLHTDATGMSVGTFPITVAGAQDGNYDIAFVEGRLSVIYIFNGFASPIEPGGTYRANRTLPLKFSLSAADGTPANQATAMLRVEPIGPDDQLAEPLDVDVAGTGDEGMRFRFSGDHYQFNLSTHGWNPGRYRLTALLDDGRSHWIEIVLR